MHSRKRGKASSRKPVGRPAGAGSLDEKKIVEHIKTLTKEGKTPSKIGAILRDEHNTPDVKASTGKTITEHLATADLQPEYPEDITALMRKSILIRKHLQANGKDETAKRGLKLTESKVMRLAKYYKSTGRMEKGWKYNPANFTYLAE